MSLKKVLLGTVMLLGATVGQAASATLTWQGGVVGSTATGATGVVVGGKSYNVSFNDGSCTSVFGGCDAVSDFDFTSQSDAQAAAQALLDLFGTSFLLGPQPLSGFIAGCETTESFCAVSIPYTFGQISGLPAYLSMAAGVSRFQAPQLTGPFASFLFSTNYEFITLARFSSATSPVPVPAALPLLATGLGALGVLGWRRKKRKLALAQA